MSDSLVAALLRRHAAAPDAVAVRYLDSEARPRDQMTYRELVAGARQAAEVLRDGGAAGQRVILLARPERAFLEWFFGCLLVGAVAVPAPPSTGRHRLERLQIMAADAEAALVVGRLGRAARRLLAGARVVAPDAHRSAAGIDEAAPPAPDAVTVLQYTSGSTRRPRGVILTHERMLHNVAQIGRSFGLGDEDRAVIWLPPHHDMGLIGGLLTPVLTGFPASVLDPGDFARRPMLWLEAVSREGATVSGGPNTAYEMAARELERHAEPPAGLDLSRWAVAFVGAEPVHGATLRRFGDAAGRSGFRPAALRPCYGLAEATLLVSSAGPGGARTRGVGAPGTRPVSAGTVVADTRVRIVDQGGHPCAPGVTGEIWVSGPGVAAGYWRAGEETDRMFRARVPGDEARYLRTGDLGYLDESGELVPTGRAKDLLIIHGRNVYPSDLELAAMRAAEPEHSGLAAAFGLNGDAEFAVLVECADPGADLDRVLGRIHSAVAAEAEHPPGVVAVVRLASLPRTTSGKVQRSRARERYLAGDCAVLGELRGTAVRPAALAAAAALRAELTGADRDERAAKVYAYLRTRLVVPEDGAPDPDRRDWRPSDAGVDSITLLSLGEELETIAGTALPRAELLAADSARAMAGQVADAWSEPAAEAWLETPAGATAGGGEPVEWPPVGQWHAATPGEAAMFLLESVVPGGTTIVAACEVEGDWAGEEIEAAVAALVERHEALRTRYRADESGVQRRVDPSAPTAVVTVPDGDGWPEARVAEWLRRVSTSPFDLGRPPLLRVHILPRGPRRRLVVVTAAHLVADFRAMTVLFTDLLRTAAELAPEPPALPYRAHVARMRAYLESPDAGAARAYFAGRLDGAEHRLALPGRRTPRAPSGGAADQLTVALDAATCRRIAELARQEGTTSFVVLLALYQALLHHHTGQRSVTVGVPVLGRDGVGFADTVGLFMNQVPTHSRPATGATLRDLVRAAREEVRSGVAHQRYPLERISAECGRGDPLFETMFLVHRARPDQPAGLAAVEVVDGAEVRLGDLRCRSVVVPRRRDTLPLTVVGAEYADGFRFAFRYLTEVFPMWTVDRLAASFAVLSARLTDQPDRAFRTVNALPAAAVPAVRPARAGGPAESLVDRVRVMGERYPHRPAIHGPSGTVSYAELVELCGRGAAALTGHGVRAGDVVAVLHDRDHTAVVLTHAILRAGAGYLHLDTESPPDRLRRLIAGSGARLIVCGDRQRAAAERLGLPLVGAADLLTGAAGTAAGAGSAVVDPDGIAYVSYTSGSSGQPKGVVVPHRAALAAADAYADEIALGPGDVVCSVSSPAWDIIVGDIIAVVARGAALCIAPDDTVLDAPALAAFLDRHRVSVMATTPHRWALLLDAGWRPPPGFRAVCGGDAMPAREVRRFRELGVHVWNFYGPTETVLWATAADLREWRDGSPVPIGRPLDGYRVRVLNPAMGPSVPGTPGELCIGGPAVAMGYLDDPRLTASRFVPDPDGPPGARLYRSGDLVRAEPDGHLVFLGRADNQVKIRGYRVETGDVEAALAASPAVASAVVAVLGEGADAELVAFVVPAEPAAIDHRALLNELAARLPRYMIPSRVLTVTEPPVTRNGKVDRAVLLRVSPPRPVEGAGPAQAPRTAMERLVARAFAEVLPGASVGVEDDFFAMGGYSLRAIQVAARLSTGTGRPVPVRAVFDHPTVTALAAHLDRMSGGRAQDAPDRPLGPAGAVTAGQRRLWFDHIAGRDGGGMLLPFLVEIRGPIEPDLIRAAFDEVVERHESLRTEVVTVAGEPRQRIGPRPTVLVHDAAPAGAPVAGDAVVRAACRRLAAMLARPCSVADGPLLRCEVLVTGPGHALLLLVVHHIIFDGWSARVLLEEFGALYAGLLGRRPADLPPLPWGEHHMARVLAATPTTPEAVRAVADRIAGAPRLRLPAPDAVPAGGPAARKRGVAIGDAASRAGRRLGATPYAVVSAALLAVLRAACGQTDLLTGLDLAGRESPEAERLVGYFGNQLPLRVDLAGATGFAEIVRRTAGALADAVAGQAVGYEHVVAELRRRDALPANAGVFDVKIVHQPVSRSPVPVGPVTMRVLDSGWASPAYPVALWVWDDGREVVLELHHRVDACPADWADAVLSRVAALVRAASGESTVELATELEGLVADAPAVPSFEDITVTPLRPPDGPVRTRLLAECGTRVLQVQAGDQPLAQWLADSPRVWRAALAEHGAVLLRGFGVRRPDDLHAATEVVFAERYATAEHPRQVLSDSVVMPVDYPAELELFWHNEDSFNRRWPATMAFACARPADQGGQTTLVDGAEVLLRLAGAAWDKFRDEGVCYVRRFVPGLGLPWSAVYRTDDPAKVARQCERDGMEAIWEGDTLTTRAHRPAVIADGHGRQVWFAQILHWHPSCLDPQTREQLRGALDGRLPRECTYGDGSPIPDDVVAELITASRAIEYAVPWQPGDLVLVNNRRLAHGRRPYQGERRVMVALGDPAS